MRDRIGLCAWLLAVLAATLVHDPAWLGGALVAAILVSGQGRRVLARRALLAVLPILAVISFGYLAMGWFTGTLAWPYLWLLNLRVLLLAVLTMWMVRDVDPGRALQGYPGAQRWLNIVRSQATLFRRQACEYRAAVQSRSTLPPTLAQRYRAGAALGLAVLDKAMYNSEALTQGMRARGALDD